MERIDEILMWIKEAVVSGVAKDMLNAEAWMRAALELNILLMDEKKKLESTRRVVAQKTLDILKSQEKRNVAAAELETQTTLEYQQMREQEHKIETVEEMIMLAKKNVDLNRY